MEYQYSKDWVTSKVSIWERVLVPIKPFKNILEIGVFEGKATIWFIQNLLDSNGYITCIDNWSWGNTRTAFNYNVAKALTDYPNKQLSTIEGNAYKELATLISKGAKYNLIYVDGNSTAVDRLSDACMAWWLLDINGILILDDYLMMTDDADIKLAVDSFCNVFKGKYKYLYVGQQVIIQKLRD